MCKNIAQCAHYKQTLKVLQAARLMMFYLTLGFSSFKMLCKNLMHQQSTFASCLHKQAEIEQLFKECHTADKKYEKIISFGRQLLPYPDAFKTPENIVQGCQSTMYLYSYLDNATGWMRFFAYSEALISSGLAALLIRVYDEECPEVILKCPPLFLEKIGIQNSISPGRSNGLASLFLKMKQQSLMKISSI
jgi:cysteine desulfuration protein SufE